MAGLATSTAQPSPAQLIARINAAGGLTGSDITSEQILRLLCLTWMVMDEQGFELPEEIINLLDGFDPDDDTNETPT